MNKSCIFFVLVALFSFQLFATAQVIFGPIDNPTNGNRYFLLQESSWTDAQQQANDLDGNLATVNDEDENRWLIDIFGNVNDVPRNLWIGYTDQQNEGEFVWASGEQSDFENWDEGEPNQTGNGEDYTHIIVDPININLEIEKWNDVPNLVTNGLRYAGVVEINVFRGDVNRDGMIDLLDVQPFVDLLTSGEFQLEADINLDGVVDLLDVGPFIELLTGI